MLALVEVIVPKVACGSAFEFPQPVAGFPNSTWLGALNISMRNWSVCLSARRKSLIVEKSKFSCLGPIKFSFAEQRQCVADSGRGHTKFTGPRPGALGQFAHG